MLDLIIGRVVYCFRNKQAILAAHTEDSGSRLFRRPRHSVTAATTVTFIFIKRSDKRSFL